MCREREGVCGRPAPKRVALEPPWEAGLARALWETWRGATWAPGSFFPLMAQGGGVRWPLAYALFWWWVLAAANAVVQQPVLSLVEPVLPYRGRVLAGFARTSPEAVVSSFAVMPLLLVPFLLTLAGVLHGLLALVGGARGRYSVTLRAACYASGSAAFWVIPCVGPLLALGWWLHGLITGLAAAHGTDRWRAAFAVCLPMASCAGSLAAALLWAAALLLRGMGMG